MGNNQAPGLHHGCGDGGYIHRRDRPQVNDFDRASIFDGGLCGGKRYRHQRTVCHDGRVCAFAHHLRLERIKVGIRKVHLALEPVAAFGLENNHRVVAFNGFTGHPIGIMR